MVNPIPLVGEAPTLGGLIMVALGGLLTGGSLVAIINHFSHRKRVRAETHLTERQATKTEAEEDGILVRIALDLAVAVNAQYKAALADIERLERENEESERFRCYAEPELKRLEQYDKLSGVGKGE
jgi:hypothetical protein